MILPEIVTSQTANQRALQEVRQELVLGKRSSFCNEIGHHQKSNVDGPVSWGNEIQSKKEKAARRVESKYIHEARGTPSDSSQISGVHSSLSGNQEFKDGKAPQRSYTKLQTCTHSAGQSHAEDSVARINSGSSFMPTSTVKIPSNICHVSDAVVREPHTSLEQNTAIRMPYRGSVLPKIGQPNPMTAVRDTQQGVVYDVSPEPPVYFQRCQRKTGQTIVLSNENLIPSASKPLLVIDTEENETNCNENTSVFPSIATRNTEFAPSYSKTKRKVKVYAENADLNQMMHKGGTHWGQHSVGDITLPNINKKELEDVSVIVKVGEEQTTYQVVSACGKLPSLAQNTQAFEDSKSIFDTQVVIREKEDGFEYTVHNPFEEKKAVTQCLTQKPLRNPRFRDVSIARPPNLNDKNVQAQPSHIPTTGHLPDITSSSARQAVPKPTWNSVTAKRGVGFQSKLRRDKYH